MKIAFNIYVVLTLVVIAQGLFAALILSTSKVNYQSGYVKNMWSYLLY